MRFVHSLIGLLLIAVSVNAQQFTLEGDKLVKFNEGFATLTVPKADNVIWRITPDPTKVRKLYGNLIFGGVPGQTYRVEATVITQVVDFEKKTSSLKIDELQQQVVFDPSPNPAPNPNPNPNPGPNPTPGPVPSDLGAKVKAQVLQDKVGKPTIEAISFAYSTMNNDASISSKSDVISVFRQIRTVIAATVDDDSADNLKALLDNEVNTQIKGKETATLDATNKALIAKIIQNVTTALDSAK